MNESALILSVRDKIRYLLQCNQRLKWYKIIRQQDNYTTLQNTKQLELYYCHCHSLKTRARIHSNKLIILTITIIGIGLIPNSLGVFENRLRAGLVQHTIQANAAIYSVDSLLVFLCDVVGIFLLPSHFQLVMTSAWRCTVTCGSSSCRRQFIRVLLRHCSVLHDSRKAFCSHWTCRMIYRCVSVCVFVSVLKSEFHWL